MIPHLLLAASVLASDAFLFTSFRGSGDGLHLAYSTDGRGWTELDRVFLKPTVGAKLMRDPHILQGPDGRYHMVWTSGWHDRGIGYASSSDLVHWSEQTFVPLMEHRPETKTCWAPELFYDDAGGQFILLWSSALPVAGQDDQHRAYYSLTRDFQHFTEPRMLFDPGFNNIDTTLLRVGDTYRIVFKETDDQPRRVWGSIHAAEADHPLGPYRLLPDPVVSRQRAEGPAPVQLGNRTLVYVDFYADYPYGVFETRDWRTWTDATDTSFVIPGQRHGSILRIPFETLQRLRAYENNQGAPEPILAGFTADPSIRVFGDTYYIYPTSDRPEWRTTEFAVWSSKNLVDWIKAGVALDLSRDVSWADIRAWAPDCIERDGKYYFYFCGDHRIGVAVGDSPTGPFQDALGKPLIQKAGKVTTNTIDPHAFIDDDGQAYLYFGNGHQAQVYKLMPDMVTLDGDPVDLTLKEFREGIVVFKRNGRYYFMWSIDDARSPDYRVGWGVSDSPLGPVRTSEEGFLVLSQNGPAVGTAHHSVVQVPGTDRWYVAYHRHAIPGGGGYQRETCLARMSFAADGSIRPMDPMVAPFSPGDRGEPVRSSPSPDPTGRSTVRIQANAKGKAISPDLVGIFFEDLNYAADGGLYAELIQNRSFEYSPTEQPSWHPLAFWELAERGGGAGSLGVAEMRPIHENNPHYALLTVERAGDGVGLANRGFDRIPLVKGEAYEASFWAYQAYMGRMWGAGDNDQPMPVTLRLESGSGEVLAEASMEVSGRAWRRRRATLRPSRTVEEGRLVLLAHEQGALCLDMVSLFPAQTFRNRPNGLRADLAQAIADLAPKFVRFPGGCLVHGTGTRRYYDWKESVGPVETRRARRNLWGYHQTRGLGYHELFQFCEDIGAKPLPVVTAGVCCQHAGTSPHRGQEGLPLEEMPAYVQDVLDLVEWANGSPTSTWGRVRAAAGHPEPFDLQYLGVGNEDAITPLFEERFRIVYDAVRAAYPEITVVGTVGPFASGPDYDRGWAFARELDLAMVDEHYYLPPQWFWENQKRYDTYDRNAAKVYVGEYAAHDRDRRRNSLRSALAEAAGLMGFERNGDLVHFSSYAPLLARRGHTQWFPDLIYFDATNVFPTANYHVQQLFGRNSGDRYLETKVATAADATSLAVSAVRDSATATIIVKIVNGAATEAPLTVNLEGLPDGERSATRIVLTGAGPDAYNEDRKPPAVKPVAADITVGPTFGYKAPAYSLTVFRVRP